MKHFQGKENSGHVDFWFGVVEDRDDPLGFGRVRVRIFGHHTDDKNKLPTGGLPWSVCMQPTTSPSTSGVGRSPTGIVTGTHVVGIWLDGSSGQYPFVIGTIPGQETGTANECQTNSNGYEAFTKGFMLPPQVQSAAYNPVQQANNVASLSWMPFAESELANSQSKDEKIQKYLAGTGRAQTSDDVPWGNAFANWVVQQGGVQGPNTDNADDWRNWGVQVTDPPYGAVATLQGDNAAGARTVGFYLGTNQDGTVSVVAPSTAGDPIQIQKVDPSKIMMYNMPPGYTPPTATSGMYAAAGTGVPADSGVVPTAATSNANANAGRVSPTREYIRKNSNMNYKYITIHCTATPVGRDIGRAEVNQMHIQRGWSEIGYHFVIRINGTVEIGRDLSKVGAHVGGHNQNNLGISLVGGVDASGKPLEGLHNYTHAQISALDMLLQECLDQWPDAEVLGHRDWPAVAKACPCFNVKTDYMKNRQRFFRNNSSQPRDRDKSQSEKDEAKKLKDPQSTSDSSKDTSEVEPTADNMQTYKAVQPQGKDPGGFQDPRGQYPTIMGKCFNGGSTVNPLVTKASVSGTPVYNSDQQRATGVPIGQAGSRESRGGGATQVNVNVNDPIGPMSTDQVKKYLNALGQKESRNRYDIVNTLGYSGRWQFGAAALSDQGYVRRGTSNRGTANPSAWLGKNGINSREDWLKSTSEQDKAIMVFTMNNYNTLRRMRVITERSDAGHVAGALMAAHLKGAGGAYKLLVQGRDIPDAYGTKPSSYYNLGKNSIN